MHHRNVGFGGLCNSLYQHLSLFLLFVSGLKDLITPVLAGLLESDISKMLSFERFFATIENISKMRVSL